LIVRFSLVDCRCVVVPKHPARHDVDTEIDYYLFEEGSVQAALRWIHAIE
jgi:toxin ParE1/3/4